MMDERENAAVLAPVNAMPAATWHFLRANETRIEVPAGLAAAPQVAFEGDWPVTEAAGEFEAALAAAQVAWEAAHPDMTPQEKAELAAFTAAEADATYGGTARSAYQAAADELEEARSLAAAFEAGAGEAAAAWLADVAGTRWVLDVASGKAAKVRCTVTGVAGAASVAALDVIARPGSTVELSILVDGQAPVGAVPEGLGVAGTTLRVFADEGSSVTITRMQTLDLGFTDVDDMGLFVHNNARSEVRQTVLGASLAYTGLAGDLRGDASQVDVDTRYLGYADQSRDFGYSLRHHGMRSRSTMDANGVLAGKSRKALRGTIDLVRGCAGSEGSERETVLLCDEGVRNITVPVILCNEDDVAGNHGATIGHIRDEQLFYLASRGLSNVAAEAMFASAVLERAALDAADEAARAGVLRLGETISPGFAGLFEE